MSTSIAAAGEISTARFAPIIQLRQIDFENWH